MTETEYTKHYFIEGERICTKIGGGFGIAQVQPTSTPLSFINGTLATFNANMASLISRDLTCVGYTGLNTTEVSMAPAYNLNNLTENSRYFYHSDHLGSASFITDRTGRASQHIQYLPYGELFISQRNSTFDSRYKFTAKELDNETNYTYFGARYYDSDLSSWLSVDPMASKFYSTSPYMFCIGNPVRLVDFNGMDTIMFNNRGNFGSPIPDNNDVDTYVKVNDTEFNTNKIDYNKKGELKNRHANKQFSKDFRLSHSEVKHQNITADTYQLNDYSEAKKIFEFFADNTAVEWAHQILMDHSSGTYLNQIATAHDEGLTLIPENDLFRYTPVDIRHSHPDGGFFSSADRQLYDNLNKYYEGRFVTRIYKAGFYHNFDNTKEYPNLQSVPSYK